ncbi:hypothetical protein OC844_000672 [Tilletia horrida]|nr:hypothetical protein OC844_000672 [Tilletia horrida]
MSDSGAGSSCAAVPTTLYSTSYSTFFSTHYTTVRATATVTRSASGPRGTSGTNDGSGMGSASTMLTLSDIVTITTSRVVPTRTLFNCITDNSQPVPSSTTEPASTTTFFTPSSTTPTPSMTTSTLVTALSLPVTTPGVSNTSLELVTVTAYVGVTASPSASLEPNGPESPSSASTTSTHTQLIIALTVTLVSLALLSLLGFFLHRCCLGSARRARRADLDEKGGGGKHRRGPFHSRKDQEVRDALKSGKFGARMTLDDILRVAQRHELPHDDDEDDDEGHHPSSTTQPDSASGSSGRMQDSSEQRQRHSGQSRQSQQDQQHQQQQKQEQNQEEQQQYEEQTTAIIIAEEVDIVQVEEIAVTTSASASAQIEETSPIGPARLSSAVSRASTAAPRPSQGGASIRSAKVTAPIDRFGFLNMAISIQGHGDSGNGSGGGTGGPSFSSSVFSSLQNALASSSEPIGGGRGGKAIEGEPPADLVNPASSGFLAGQRRRLSAMLPFRRSTTGSLLEGPGSTYGEQQQQAQTGSSESLSQNKRDSLKRQSTNKRLSALGIFYGSASKSDKNKLHQQLDMGPIGGGVPAVSDLVRSDSALGNHAAAEDNLDALYVAEDRLRFSAIVLTENEEITYLPAPREEEEGGEGQAQQQQQQQQAGIAEAVALMMEENEDEDKVDDEARLSGSLDSAPARAGAAGQAPLQSPTSVSASAYNTSLLTPSSLQDGSTFHPSTSSFTIASYQGTPSSVALTRNSSSTSIDGGSPRMTFTPIDKVELQNQVAAAAAGLDPHMPIRRVGSPAIVLSPTSAQAETQGLAQSSMSEERAAQRSASPVSHQPNSRAASPVLLRRPESTYSRLDGTSGGPGGAEVMYLDPMHGYMYSRTNTPTFDAASVIASSPIRHSINLPRAPYFPGGGGGGVGGDHTRPAPSMPLPNLPMYGSNFTRSGSVNSRSSESYANKRYTSGSASGLGLGAHLGPSRQGSIGGGAAAAAAARRSMSYRYSNGTGLHTRPGTATSTDDDGLPPSLYAHLDLPAVPPRSSFGSRDERRSEDAAGNLPISMALAAQLGLEADAIPEETGAEEGSSAGGYADPARRPASPRRSGRFSPISLRKLAEPFLRSTSPTSGVAPPATTSPALSPMVMPLHIDPPAMQSRDPSFIAASGTTSPLAVLVETLAIERSKSCDGGSAREVAAEMAREWEREMREQPQTSSDGHLPSNKGSGSSADSGSADAEASGHTTSASSTAPVPASQLLSRTKSDTAEETEVLVTEETETEIVVVEEFVEVVVPVGPAISRAQSRTQGIDEEDSNDSLISDSELHEDEDDDEDEDEGGSGDKHSPTDSRRPSPSPVDSRRHSPLLFNSKRASVVDALPTPPPRSPTPSMPLPISKDRLSWSHPKTSAHSTTNRYSTFIPPAAAGPGAAAVASKAVNGPSGGLPGSRSQSPYRNSAFILSSSATTRASRRMSAEVSSSSGSGSGSGSGASYSRDSTSTPPALSGPRKLITSVAASASTPTSARFSAYISSSSGPGTGPADMNGLSVSTTRNSGLAYGQGLFPTSSSSPLGAVFTIDENAKANSIGPNVSNNNNNNNNNSGSSSSNDDDDGSVSHLSHVGELLWRQTMGALAIANASAGDYAESALSHDRPGAAAAAAAAALAKVA